MSTDVPLIVRRWLSEEPGTRVVFTSAIAVDAHHFARGRSGSVLFLHPAHRAAVSSLRPPPAQ